MCFASLFTLGPTTFRAIICTNKQVDDEKVVPCGSEKQTFMLSGDDSFELSACFIPIPGLSEYPEHLNNKKVVGYAKCRDDL